MCDFWLARYRRKTFFVRHFSKMAVACEIFRDVTTPEFQVGTMSVPNFMLKSQSEFFFLYPPHFIRDIARPPFLIQNGGRQRTGGILVEF